MIWTKTLSLLGKYARSESKHKRPILQNIHIHREEIDDKVLQTATVTDSFSLLSVEEGVYVDITGDLDKDLLIKPADQVGADFKLKNVNPKYLNVDVPAIVDGSEGKFPDFKHVIPQGEGLASVAVDPKILAEMLTMISKLGTKTVVLTIHGDTKAIKIEPLGFQSTKFVSLVMPVRR